MKRIDKLNEKAKSVLKTLCSNYRGSMQVRASFTCSYHYGLTKFIAETQKQLDKLIAADILLNARISDEDTDPDTELCYFTVNAELNLSIEDMAEIAANSQTIFKV